MTVRLWSVVFDANDRTSLARFWAEALDGTYTEGDGYSTIARDDGAIPRLGFITAQAPKISKNRIHLDLESTSVEEQHHIVERLIGLGARHIDIGQGPDATHFVLADPEGNEFCVVDPDNFTKDGGIAGGIVFDASGPDVGYFWSTALDWPLVWDQDDETAIRAPDGKGQFITFGPPLHPKTEKNRLHLDIAPPAEGDQAAEVERLITLGARRVDIGQGDVSWVVMTDPDDNEFCVLTPR